MLLIAQVIFRKEATKNARQAFNACRALILFYDIDFQKSTVFFVFIHKSFSGIFAQ
jgi:hypothetical protein